ncbi:MAG: helix-turn-helix transcriptional regulator [Paenibacillaceae bacterium]|nr:helix-turn-helix transcriptional regulator [Paenibacillaceae bacterium]
MEIRIKLGDRYLTIDHLTTNLMKDRLDSRGDLHSHPVFHFMYILEGNGVFTVGGYTTDAKPGMLYIVNPDVPHQFYFGSDGPLTNLECTFRLTDDTGKAAVVDFFDECGLAVTEEGRHTPYAVPARFKPMLSEGFEHVIDAFTSPRLQQHADIMVADLWARIETVLRTMLQEGGMAEMSDDTVASVKRFLLANRHRPVKLKEAADFAHVTPNYLCRLFKEQSGDTPMGYLQTARMREAEKLLAYTDLPIYAIAERLGYEEPSYFARVYRETFGQSPQAHRRRMVAENRIK